MAALTSGRITPQRMGYTYPSRAVVGVKANTTLQIGGMVGVDSQNRAVPMSLATGLVCVGVLNEQPGGIPGQPVVGSAVDRAIQAQVTRGEFAYDNDGTVLATTPYGTPLFAVDDHTVSLTSTGASSVGYLTQVTAPTDQQIGSQVWVMIGIAPTP